MLSSFLATRMPSTSLLQNKYVQRVLIGTPSAFLMGLVLSQPVQAAPNDLATQPQNGNTATAPLDPQTATLPNSPFNTRLPHNPSLSQPASPTAVMPTGDSASMNSNNVNTNNGQGATSQGQAQLQNANDNESLTPITTDIDDILASELNPTPEQLSQANEKLLTNNARLQRHVDNLETRVNVLINERSGQLFMYGAISVIFSLLLGFVIGWFIFGRRDNW